MQNSYNDEKEVIYAGFFVRLSAYLVDSLIVGAALLVLRVVFYILTLFLPDGIRQTEILFSYTLIDIILYFAHAAYFVALTYCTGTTLGKRLFHLRVISTGTETSLWNLIYRETIGRFLSSVFVCAGYIVAGIDREKRGVHDMLADTRVIYERTF